MAVMAAEVVSLMPKPPRDKLLLTWQISFLLGVGILLPWNIFITESRYFDARVHEPPYPPLLANNFESLFAAVYQGSSCLTLTLFVLMRGKIKGACRVLIPLVVQAVLLLLTILSVPLKKTSGSLMLGFTLPGLALSGASAALLQGGFIGMIASFPPVYMQSVLSGMALAGLLVSASSVASCAFASGSDDAAIFNFSSGFVTLLACIAAYFVLYKLPFARYHLLTASTAKTSGADDYGGVGGGSVGAGAVDEYEECAAADLESSVEDEARGVDEHISSLGEEAAADMKLSLLSRPRPRRSSTSLSSSVDVRIILYKVRWHFASIVLTFVASLSVFPGIIALIVSTSNESRPPLPHPPSGRIFGDCFSPLLFTVFNAMDLAGRLAGGAWATRPPKAKKVTALVAARLVVVPLLCLCNVVSGNPDVNRIGDGNGWRLPVIFRSDVSCFLLVGILGFTNGLPASVVMMHVPTELDESEREAGGALMAWAIVVGVACGSTISLLLSASLSY